MKPWYDRLLLNPWFLAALWFLIIVALVAVPIWVLFGGN